MSLKKKIVSFAESQGADLIGIADAGVYSDYLKEVGRRLHETGAAGKDYMLPEDAMTFFEKLSDVRNTLASARTIIILGVYSFDTEGDYKAIRRKLLGKTARVYAYYPVVRKIAEQVAAFIEELGHQAVQGQHVPLKHAANRIGLGSYGRNGLIQTSDYGSFVAWRDIVTDAELEPDAFEAPATECEECGRCLKACPTGALYAPYKVNPALCINPLTRKEDDVPERLRKKMGRWVCGCDICQEVCPANRRLNPRTPDPRAGFDPSHHDSHKLLEGLARKSDLLRMLENERIPVMQRNAAIALANIGNREALEVLRNHREDCRGKLGEYIVWAIDRAAKRMER
jgi:epoxyqueuosine reductase